jgi:intein-encoded DNA endonuclease-like protein
MRIPNRAGFLKGKDTEIIDLYREGKGCDIISKKYGCNSESIRLLLQRNNVILRGKSTYRKHKINHEYFSKITTQEQAWLLGFIMADGSISRHNRGYFLRIDLAVRDKEILKKIISLLECDYYIANNHKRKSCCLTISSKKIIEDLSKYGIVPNKTYMKGHDLRNLISPDLWRHFFKWDYWNKKCSWQYGD